MALLGGDDNKDKPKSRPSVAVGDIVLLRAGESVPAPAIVLGVNEDGTLNVNDLSGRYGSLTGVTPNAEDSDPSVLTWTAR